MISYDCSGRQSTGARCQNRHRNLDCIRPLMFNNFLSLEIIPKKLIEDDWGNAHFLEKRFGKIRVVHSSNDVQETHLRNNV